MVQVTYSNKKTMLKNSWVNICLWIDVIKHYSLLDAINWLEMLIENYIYIFVGK